MQHRAESEEDPIGSAAEEAAKLLNALGEWAAGGVDQDCLGACFLQGLWRGRAAAGRQRAGDRDEDAQAQQLLHALSSPAHSEEQQDPCRKDAHHGRTRRDQPARLDWV